MGFFNRKTLGLRRTETVISTSISPKDASPHGPTLDNRGDIEKRDPSNDGENGRSSTSNADGRLLSDQDHTRRSLKTRHIQLIGIGGTIGTTLFVQIGHGLIAGGPASLFITFSLCPTR
ncbi:hypothetical protein KEM56_007536 [Ascosphaera pollenicola]|nr:hypothetical protein KEM56_007536 [Ascosphaera pollenicola]